MGTNIDGIRDLSLHIQFLQTVVMAPVVRPAAGTSAAAVAAATHDAEIGKGSAAAGVDSPTEKMKPAAVNEKGAAAEPAMVGGLIAEGHAEHRVVEEMPPTGVEEMAAPAAGWAALAETASS